MDPIRIYRHPEAMWREEDTPRKEALDGLLKGQDVSELGTSIVLLKGTMHVFNILGTEIWKLCEGKTVDEIISTLQQGFEVDEAVLRKDVDTFLAELRELGLLRYAE